MAVQCALHCALRLGCNIGSIISLHHEGQIFARAMCPEMLAAATQGPDIIMSSFLLPVLIYAGW